MKKAILLCVVVLALLVKAQSTEPNPTAWYTPLDYEKPEKMEGYTTITDSRGNTQEVSFELGYDDDGNVTSSTLQSALADIKVNVNTAIQLIDAVLYDLAKAVYDIDYIKAQIKTLGENLTKVFQVDGMKFKIGDKTYNLKIAKGALKTAITTGTTVEYKDENGLFTVPDDKTLESVKGSDGLYYLRLKNKPANTVAGQGKIPYLTSALELDWFSLKDKLDNLSLGIKKGYSKYGEIEDKGIQIKGWEDASPDTAYTLGEVLAGSPSHLTDQQDDHVITRSSDGTLNYVEIGSLKAAGAPIDGASITTNEIEGATEQGVASLYGWSTTKEATKENKMLPYAADGVLSWSSLTGFFSSFFELDKEGKITLSGIEADPDDPVRIMTVSSSDTGAAVTTKSITDIFDYPLVREEESTTISLDGWGEESAMETTLADAIQAEEKTEAQNFSVLARDKAQKLQYVPLGKISPDKNLVDEASITTNEVYGAEENGVTSLRGWSTASTLGIPYKTSNEVLGWFKQEDVIDDLSIGIVDGLIPGDTLGKFEIKGASKQTANNRYFGTPAAGLVSLGWYDLPNVTTNAVEGDEKTITTVSNEGGIKKLGWKHSPPVSEDWVFGARSLADGNIEWLPLPEIPTNFIAGVDNVTITTNDQAVLQFKGWDEFSQGVIGKAENGSLVCKTLLGTNGVEHIEDESTLAFGLAGFAKGNNCEENLADLMRLGSSTHKVLARFASTAQDKPSLHYVPLGELSAPPLDNVTLKTNDVGAAMIAGFTDAVDGGVLTKRGNAVAWETAAVPDIDNTTIVTNTAQGAVADGSLSIAGFTDAADGKVLTKRDGAIAWEDGGLKPDNASVATNAQGNLTISGFRGASAAAIPIKKNNTSLDWKVLSAGHGMLIEETDNTVIISSTLDTSGAFTKISFVSDIRYDETTHELIVVKTTVSAKILNDATTEESVVFTAVSHADEHPVE